MPGCLQEVQPETRQHSHKDRVSKAPLHRACKTRQWISRGRLKALKADFPDLNTRKWSREEKKRLRRNWKYIVKHHSRYSDPKFAFGVGHDNESHMSSDEIDDRKKQYNKFDIMLRMGYKLENRLICDIYMKCRRMFYDKSFYFHSRHQVPAELEKRVKLDLNTNESPQVIAYKYNIAPSVIDTIKRRPNVGRRFKWTATATDDLIQIVDSFCNASELDNLQARKINWQRVCELMALLDYEITEEQCYNKWTRLNPHSMRKRYVEKDEFD